MLNVKKQPGLSNIMNVSGKVMKPYIQYLNTHAVELGKQLNGSYYQRFCITVIEDNLLRNVTSSVLHFECKQKIIIFETKGIFLLPVS